MLLIHPLTPLYLLLDEADLLRLLSGNVPITLFAPTVDALGLILVDKSYDGGDITVKINDFTVNTANILATNKLYLIQYVIDSVLIPNRTF